MKKLAIISGLFLAMGIAFTGCDSKRQPGKIYMPDMAYSRAYESYAEQDSTKFTTYPAKKGGRLIYYNNSPVTGTIKRGELFPYTLPNDSNGYKMSAMVKNPLDSMSALELPEAQRLFNINCAICHGDKGAGNGPLATSGKIGGIANLTLPLYIDMKDGTMFHSITYGRNNMGSYASQLSREQRWMMVNYIRTLQPKAGAATAATTAAPAPAKTDSAAVKKG